MRTKARVNFELLSSNGKKGMVTLMIHTNNSMNKCKEKIQHCARIQIYDAYIDEMKLHKNFRQWYENIASQNPNS